jgi:group I intron endonuclease
MGCCYLVTNEINEKCYVGITKYQLNTRKKSHLRMAIERNSDLVFHKAIRKYGPSSFHWQVVYENKDYEQLKKREIMLIDLYSSHISKHGYNMTLGGDGTLGIKRFGKENGMFGRNHTDEVKKKISKLNSGKYKGHKNPMFGVHRYGKEAPRYGIKCSDEAKKKIGDANRGEKSGCYGRTGDKHPMFGNNHTDESKKKISESSKKRWADPEYKKRVLESRRKTLEKKKLNANN